MKTYIVIHNLNSRGKNLSQEYIEDLFKSKNIPFKYFSTSTINELNNVVSLSIQIVTNINIVLSGEMEV